MFNICFAFFPSVCAFCSYIGLRFLPINACQIILPQERNIYEKTKIFIPNSNIKNNFRDYIELFRVLRTIYEIMYQFIIFE